MWLRNNAKEDFPWDEDVCCYAAQYGRQDMLQWARAQDPPCPWDAWACMHAARNVRLGVLQWTRSHRAP